MRMVTVESGGGRVGMAEQDARAKLSKARGKKRVCCFIITGLSSYLGTARASSLKTEYTKIGMQDACRFRDRCGPLRKPRRIDARPASMLQSLRILVFGQSNHMNKAQKSQAEKRRSQFKSLVADNTSYPLATITYHGPTPEEATRIAVAVLPDQAKDPVIRYWSGENIAENKAAAREIAAFLKAQQVERVITSEWVLSCPHEEGVDYPAGEDCPYCPAWKSDDP